MPTIIRCTACGLALDVTRQQTSAVVSCSCGAPITVPAADAPRGLLFCPHCGSPGTAGCRTCHHCRAELKTVLCHACFSFGFHGSNHCAKCGERICAAPPAERLDLPCPRCGDALVRHALGEAPVSSCEGCGGVLLTHDTFEGLEAALRERSEPAEQVERFPPPPPQPPGMPVYIRCPKCEKPMARRSFAARSGVVIDLCPDHGMWFDAEELTAVIRYLEAGGERDSGSRDPEEEFRRGISPPRGLARLEELIPDRIGFSLRPSMAPLALLFVKSWRTMRR